MSFFTLFFIMILHLLLLHKNLSKVFDMIGLQCEKIVLLLCKNLFLLCIFLFLIILICSKNCIFVHYDNFVKILVFSTPFFIEPEWYFLPYYCILRAIPQKLIGVLILCFTVFFYFLILFWNLKFRTYNIPRRIELLNKLNFLLFSYFFVSLILFCLYSLRTILSHPYHLFGTIH